MKKLYVNVFAGENPNEDFYPYKMSNQYIGFLLDRDLSHLSTDY